GDRKAGRGKPPGSASSVSWASPAVSPLALRLLFATRAVFRKRLPTWVASACGRKKLSTPHCTPLYQADASHNPSDNLTGNLTNVTYTSDHDDRRDARAPVRG